MMETHAEYCASGDHTLEALSHAFKSVLMEPADDHLVLLVSDANMRRYVVFSCVILVC